MVQTRIRTTWNGQHYQALTWRAGNTLVSTFYAGLTWMPADRDPIDPRDQHKDVMTLAREMWDNDNATFTPETI